MQVNCHAGNELIKVILRDKLENCQKKNVINTTKKKKKRKIMQEVNKILRLQYDKVSH